MPSGSAPPRTVPRACYPAASSKNSRSRVRGRSRPEVLFLDEPTANLDPGATREVETIVALIHASGTKIVMTTHNLGQARRLGDEILFIAGGRLAEHAPVERFFAQPSTAEAAAFIKGELPWS